MGASHSIQEYLGYSSSPEVATKDGDGKEELEEEERGPAGPARRHPDAAKLRPTCRFASGPQMSTLYESFQRGLALSGDRACVGHRGLGPDEEDQLVYLTYNRTQRRATRFGSGLLHLRVLQPTPAADVPGEGAAAYDESKGATTQAYRSRPVPRVHAPSCLGIFLANCTEWVVADLACLSYSFVTVPLFRGADPAYLAAIITRVGLSTVVVGEAEARILLDAAKNDHSIEGLCSVLRTVIVVAPEVSPAIRAAAAEAGVRVYTFGQVEGFGLDDTFDHVPPNPYEAATLSFASAAAPGIVLTHRNMVASAGGLISAGLLDLEATDRCLVALPLAHVHQRIFLAAVWAHGAAAALHSDEVDAVRGNNNTSSSASVEFGVSGGAAATASLLEDLRDVRPTILAGTPGLFASLHVSALVNREDAGADKVVLFRRALTTKMYWAKRGYFKYGLWDRTVFRDLNTELGVGRLRLTCCFAPRGMPVEEHEFVRAAFGVPCVVASGPVECAAAATATALADGVTGHVGGPLPCCEVRLAHVPKLGFFATDAEAKAAAADGANEDADEDGGDEESKEGKDAKAKSADKDAPPLPLRGEICIRGPNVFPGYWEDDVATDNAVDEDGWFHTGECGEWNRESGALQLLGRMANIVQLPNGDLVRLDAIEEVVLSSPLVAQVYVTVVRSALVAIVHPDERYVRRAASRQGNRLQGDLTDMQSTCSSDAFKEAALNEILRVTRKAKLPAHARICAVVLAPSCFSRENGLIDAEGGSMRRESIKKRFKSQLIQASREA